MKDVFYTILIIWILWRILNSVNNRRVKNNSARSAQQRKQGETTVDYIPPKNKGKFDGEGEYVDYEEVK